jgi:hypothetical protein
MQLASDFDSPGVVEGQTFIQADFNTPDSELVGSYYSFETEAFIALPPKPSDDYDFDGQTRQWVLNTQRASDNAIQKRNMLLYQCDWTQLPDVPVPNREAWAVYRQALRDITAQPEYPEHIQWPVEP